MKYFKPFAIILVLVAIGYFFLNLDYFWKHIRFVFIKPDVEQQQQHKLDDPGNKKQEAVLEPNTIAIPSLGVTAPIVEPTGNTESEFQKALIEGVVHFPGTANPGEAGNVYIFGHSSDFPWSQGKFKTVFALLPEIKTGAEILLSDESGKTYRYAVYDQFVAAKTDTYLLDQGEYKENILTLQTSYPIGTALKRYIVRARLVVDTPE